MQELTERSVSGCASGCTHGKRRWEKKPQPSCVIRIMWLARAWVVCVCVCVCVCGVWMGWWVVWYDGCVSIHCECSKSI